MTRGVEKQEVTGERMRKIRVPLSEEMVNSLRAGEEVLLSGVIYSARDMAHKRLCESIERGEELPVDLSGAVIYYVGPTPARPGGVIGSAGPTTSSRMDSFAVKLLSQGVRATIGKGYRGEEVRRALRQYGGVHFSALGGAAALLSKHITACEVVAYEDLGTEAVRRLDIVDFPVVVAYDRYGRSVYENQQ